MKIARNKLTSLRKSISLGRSRQLPNVPSKTLDDDPSDQGNCWARLAIDRNPDIMSRKTRTYQLCSNRHLSLRATHFISYVYLRDSRLQPELIWRINLTPQDYIAQAKFMQNYRMTSSFFSLPYIKHEHSFHISRP